LRAALRFAPARFLVPTFFPDFFLVEDLFLLDDFFMLDFFAAFFLIAMLDSFGCG
jgi:hypothetical protein